MKRNDEVVCAIEAIERLPGLSVVLETMIRQCLVANIASLIMCVAPDLSTEMILCSVPTALLRRTTG